MSSGNKRGLGILGNFGLCSSRGGFCDAFLMVTHSAPVGYVEVRIVNAAVYITKCARVLPPYRV